MNAFDPQFKVHEKQGNPKDGWEALALFGADAEKVELQK